MRNAPVHLQSSPSPVLVLVTAGPGGGGGGGGGGALPGPYLRITLGQKLICRGFQTEYEFCGKTDQSSRSVLQ